MSNRCNTYTREPYDTVYSIGMFRNVIVLPEFYAWLLTPGQGRLSFGGSRLRFQNINLLRPTNHFLVFYSVCSCITSFVTYLTEFFVDFFFFSFQRW